jgi:hypothetical protein
MADDSGRTGAVPEITDDDMPSDDEPLPPRRPRDPHETDSDCSDSEDDVRFTGLRLTDSA